MCALTLDPRSKAEFGPATSRYYRKMAALPSTSLEVPTFDDDPFLIKGNRSLTAPDSCMIWSIGTICDNGYLSEKLMGSKPNMANGGELCWDKVDMPNYSFSPINGLQAFDHTRPGIKMT